MPRIGVDVGGTNTNAVLVERQLRLASHLGRSAAPQKPLERLDSRFRGNDGLGVCGDPWSFFSAGG